MDISAMVFIIAIAEGKFRAWKERDRAKVGSFVLSVTLSVRDLSRQVGVEGEKREERGNEQGCEGREREKRERGERRKRRKERKGRE